MRDAIVTDSTAQNSTIASEQSPKSDPAQPVIFFDGVCGLCNHFVNFVMARDHTAIFLFAPLQGTTAGCLLALPLENALDSVVLWDSGTIYQKSSAVVRILWKLGGLWKILGCLLWIIPLPLRNWGYSIVAKLRYRLFGKKEVCRMPKPEERSRFLE